MSANSLHCYPDLPSAAFGQQLRRRLLAWFRRKQRNLPWRLDRDPYRIWVSEVMLQQTQVATVIPYFERFLKAFPTLASLAAAKEQEVLKLWEGMGYYRRARDLHQAAQLAVREHAGQVPVNAAMLGTLPGIGRYTLNAILSQAFDLRLPIVEANSARVLCRWFACQDDPQSTTVRRWLWQAAEKLLPKRGAGEFNQAVMELGALVCTPRQPRCHECPVAACCAAQQKGVQDQIPRPSKQPTTTAVDEAAVVLHRGPKVLLVQRPRSASRWAGLWEFPHGELRAGESARSAAERLIVEATGLRARLQSELTTIRHSITRYVITIQCFHAECLGGRFRSGSYARGRWVLPEDICIFPLSTPQRHLAKALAGAAGW